MKLCLIFLALLFGAAQATPKKPNVIFIILDDMQSYMFNCLPEGKGKNLTPNIDRLAEEGVLMMGQHVSSPVCTPSRYSCLTGQYASRSLDVKPGEQAVLRWNAHIEPTDITLPKLLQQAGYSTGIVGKNHVISGPKITSIPLEGNPRDPAIASKLKAYKPQYETAMRQAGFDFAGGIFPKNPDAWKPRALKVHNLDFITQAAFDFLDNQTPEKPFFLYYASTIPHGPTHPQRSWDADPLATPYGMLDKPLDVLPARKTIGERIKRANLKASDSQENMLWLDDSIGALLSRLEQQKVLDNTIIFFFNDHGQASKGTLYQGGISNPAIIWRKGGWPCGKINETLVSNIDFAPTILDLVSAPTPDKQFDGKSFKKVLFGSKDSIHESLYAELGFSRAVIKDNWKYLALRYPEYVQNMSLEERASRLKRRNKELENRRLQPLTTDPMAPFSHVTSAPGGGHAEHKSTGKRSGYYDIDQLYDLSKDPGENHNLASDPKYAAKLTEMKAELKKHLVDLPGSFAELKKAKE